MATWDGILPTFAAGEIPTASKLQTLSDALAGLVAPETAWTPTVRFGPTNWTLGNAVLDCSYRRSGKLVKATAWIELGSTTTGNGGNGPVNVSLPVNARRASGAAPVGQAFSFSTVGGDTYDWTAYLVDASHVAFFHDQAVLIDDSPMAWAPGAQLRFDVTYEAA